MINMEHGGLYYTFLRWTKWSKHTSILYRYLESKVPEYELPPLLIKNDGSKVKNSNDWYEFRRNELLNLLKTHEYGRSPKYSGGLKYKVIEHNELALNGLAIRKQIGICLHPDDEDSIMNLLIYLPVDDEKPIPLIVGLNFYGNQTIHRDRRIILPKTWIRNKESYGITNNRATHDSRGVRSYRWPVEFVLKQGFGLATAYYGDICPDRNDGCDLGVNNLYKTEKNASRKVDDWGAISAWAWGLSRAMDYFEDDDDIDEHNIGVMGHSRLGKTSLWAGAQDERFSYIIASASGCGGAALSKRSFGETVKLINDRFPHWFCKNFEKYNANECNLPIDQHMLIALNAPRPLYVSMADRDLWADPKGMYEAMVEADKAYKLLGTQGLPDGHKLEVGKHFYGQIGFHMRPGGHDVLKSDWEHYLKFIKLHMK
ncbi:MAG: acetylxylan esterase [Candidatus Lokiarchaeota archaeon]|nr:acetylxylan esterase [Candidatus Lokiarchaeota archaeon]